MRLIPMERLSSTITQTVINTTFRMTYSDVNDILAGDEEGSRV